MQTQPLQRAAPLLSPGSAPVSNSLSGSQTKASPCHDENQVDGPEYPEVKWLSPMTSATQTTGRGSRGRESTAPTLSKKSDQEQLLLQHYV